MKEQVKQKAFALSTEEGIVSNEFIVKTAFRNKTKQINTWKQLSQDLREGANLTISDLQFSFLNTTFPLTH